MDIEKEVKKMTLGHEIGAGASCLKCKDKCEGFDLHFWRKVCRNCKCGVEDHDVQLESEESMKVGKLFEDTKYTGLIAKLKRDGIPSYRGNQVTISIPAASISTAVPYSPASSPITQSPHPPVPAPLPGSSPAARPIAATASAVHKPGQVQAVSASAVTPGRVSAASTVLVPTALPAKKETVKSVTYEWAPPGIDQSLALRYMELLPAEQRPIAGSAGADYRKKQMVKQLPEHDQDPERCHELSPGEVKLMQQYVRKYKDEALGMGDITVPEEMGRQMDAAGEKRPKGHEGHLEATVGKVGTPGTVGMSLGGSVGNYSCSQCKQPMMKGEPAVFAERAGFDKLWHPACFVCCTCKELLVDMIYFWKKGQLLCGRHYGDSEKPRCAGCDELIFSNEYTQAEGHDWHLKHFCCFDCDCVLAGETYVMENDKPVCKPCYMRNHAVCCTACQNPIEPEAQRVSYGEHQWHAEAGCFQCSCCSKVLMGQRFMALQGMLLCSVECKKKITAS